MKSLIFKGDSETGMRSKSCTFHPLHYFLCLECLKKPSGRKEDYEYLGTLCLTETEMLIMSGLCLSFLADHNRGLKQNRNS